MGEKITNITNVLSISLSCVAVVGYLLHCRQVMFMTSVHIVQIRVLRKRKEHQTTFT